MNFTGKSKSVLSGLVEEHFSLTLGVSNSRKSGNSLISNKRLSGSHFSKDFLAEVQQQDRCPLWTPEKGVHKEDVQDTARIREKEILLLDAKCDKACVELHFNRLTAHFLRVCSSRELRNVEKGHRESSKERHLAVNSMGVFDPRSAILLVLVRPSKFPEADLLFSFAERHAKVEVFK